MLGLQPMDILNLATSPCDGLVAGWRELRHGARLVPLCGITMYLGRASLGKQNSAPESGCLSVSLSLCLSVSLSLVSLSLCLSVSLSLCLSVSLSLCLSVSLSLCLSVSLSVSLSLSLSLQVPPQV